MKKTLIFIFLLTFTFIVFQTPVNATGSEASIIITNPGEDVSSQMNISWHMDEVTTNGHLIYTTIDDLDWSEANTIYGNYELIDIFKDQKINKYSVNLINLESDTEYMYKVGDNVYSDIRYFKTAGANEFSFVWTGDSHSYLPIPKRSISVGNIISKAIEVQPSVDFLFSTGDDVAYGSDYLSWQDLFNKNQTNSYMWASTMGNHDNMNNHTSTGDSDNFVNAITNYPENSYGNQDGVSYFFKYSNALFIVLNSTEARNAASIKQAQDWAGEVIKNNPSQYIFVSIHYNWFSGQDGSSYQYTNWKKFFDTHGVDLALSGHNHVYMRTHKLNGDKVIDGDGSGTIYMQTSSSDNDRGREMTENPSNSEKIAKMWTENGPTIGAIIIDVNEDGIRTRLINSEGIVQDEAEYTANRQAPDIANFNKDHFMESFSYSSSKINQGTGTIISALNGVEFVEKIEYYDSNNELLAVNQYNKRDESYFSILGIDNLEFVNIKVYFKDNTIKTINLKTNNNDNELVSNLKVNVENGKFKLSWQYSGLNNEVTNWVFIDDKPIKEIKLNDLYTYIDAIDAESTIELRIDKNSVNSRVKTSYMLFGDINLDGEVNNEDVDSLLEHMIGNIFLPASVLKLADINLDGEISLIDISYIHLYINENFSDLNAKNYTITFVNHVGNVIKKVKIKAADNLTPPELSFPEEFIFVGWNMDLNNISSDMIVSPILERIVIEEQGDFNG
jgi:hypothetical protein